MTYRFIAYGIQKHIKQNFDDAEVTINQIIFWVNIIVKRLRYERIKKSKSNAYLTYFPNISVFTEAVTGRKYSILPEAIVDLDNDYGIDTVCHAASNAELSECEDPLQNPFSRTSVKQVSTLFGNPFRKPNAKNVVYYRNRMKINDVLEEVIIYAGLECVDIDIVDMYLFSNEDPSVVCDLDTEVNITPEQEKILYYEVLNLARFGFMIPVDNKNDGSDTSTKGNKAVGIQPVQQDSDVDQNDQQQ